MYEIWRKAHEKFKENSNNVKNEYSKMTTHRQKKATKWMKASEEETMLGKHMLRKGGRQVEEDCLT